MRITFLSPPPNLSGGERVIAIYAQRLAARGHDVEVVCSKPRQPTVLRSVKNLLKGRGWPKKVLKEASHFANLGINFRVVRHHGAIRKSDITPSDVVVATWWETAEWLAELRDIARSCIYFVQHHEVHAHLPHARSRATYLLPYRKICVSEWLSDIMLHEYGDQSVALVPNAVEGAHFQMPKRQKNSSFTVGLMYGGHGYKGSDIALQALKIARDHTSLKVVAFGRRRPKGRPHLDMIDIFHESPAQHTLPEIYGCCDAWLFSSRQEGFGLPILEAMACRTPVIGTPAGAAPELIGQGGGILVRPEDPEDMARAIIRIAETDPMSWRQMSDTAYQTATSYTWDDATDRFEAAVRASADGKWEQHCKLSGQPEGMATLQS